MSRDRYLDHLSNVPMFEALSRKELTQLARLAEDVEVPAGRELTREGAIGREFFVIAKGKAAVYKGKRKVANLGPGDFFGELSLLDGGPRTATVKAETDLEVVLMAQREFLGLIREAPSLSLKLLKGMARRLRDSDKSSVH